MRKAAKWRSSQKRRRSRRGEPDSRLKSMLLASPKDLSIAMASRWRAFSVNLVCLQESKGPLAKARSHELLILGFQGQQLLPKLVHLLPGLHASQAVDTLLERIGWKAKAVIPAQGSGTSASQLHDFFPFALLLATRVLVGEPFDADTNKICGTPLRIAGPLPASSNADMSPSAMA